MLAYLLLLRFLFLVVQTKKCVFSRIQKKHEIFIVYPLLLGIYIFRVQQRIIQKNAHTMLIGNVCLAFGEDVWLLEHRTFPVHIYIYASWRGFCGPNWDWRGEETTRRDASKGVRRGSTTSQWMHILIDTLLLLLSRPILICICSICDAMHFFGIIIDMSNIWMRDD